MKRHFSQFAVYAISLAFCGYACNRTPAEKEAGQQEPEVIEIKVEFKLQRYC